MNIKEALKYIEKQITDPLFGLPEDIFLFITRITPMVNVDLLIKDENKRTLLSWRNDKYHEPGWHVPGGVVRVKEKLEERIQKVAETEIGIKIKFDPIPLALNQVILSRKTRGHFISLLYSCFLSNKFIPKNINLTNKDQGFLKWHEFCPKNLLKVQRMYQKYI